jgi:cation:H+ antiporter
VGTAVGSSVAQISFVLGVAALFHYITIANRQLKLLGLELVGATVLLFIVAMDGVLTRADGFILMSVVGVYVGHTIINRRGDLEVEPQAEVVVEEAGVPRRALVELALVALGLWIVVLSSDITVEQALHLSRGWGLQQSFVGAILVGIGTSTPELAVSLRAIMHGRTGLSVGNVVGSNIFDLLVPTGVAAVISGLDVDGTVIGYDLPYLLLVTLVVIFFLRRVRGLQKWEGAGLLALYLVYAVGRFLLDPR